MGDGMTTNTGRCACVHACVCTHALVNTVMYLDVAEDSILLGYDAHYYLESFVVFPLLTASCLASAVLQLTSFK
jgi:hypothetical protein